MATEMPAGFAERVTAWVRERRPDFAKLISVASKGSDWGGDTEGGFYPTFRVEIVYESQRGRTKHFDVEGEEMASLWQWVVDGWTTERGSE